MNNSLITLRRRERAILENAVELICALDEGLNFIDAMSAAHSVVGYKPEDLMLRRAVDIVVDDEKEIVKNTSHQRLNHPTPRTVSHDTDFVIWCPVGYPFKTAWGCS